MLAPPSTVSTPCKHGHTRGRAINRECKECKRLRQVAYRKANIAKITDNQQIMFRAAKARARKGGYACTITFNDTIVPEFCPLLGIRLERNAGRTRAASPSLDKIIPSLGCVRGNIWVISWRANTLKNNATLEELQKLVENLTVRVRLYPWEA